MSAFFAGWFSALVPAFLFVGLPLIIKAAFRSAVIQQLDF